MNEIDQLAKLLRQHNQIGEQISAVIGRPALTGHLGEFIASRIFEIDLERSANMTGHDGRFRVGPLAGKTVNVKCYLKLETLDINPKARPDFFLVLAGPRSRAVNSRGASRPFVIAHVFLFDAAQLCATLEERNVKLQTGTSLRRDLWDAAELYPDNRSTLYSLSDAQRSTLALFAPDV
jgi:hypothetical protein